MTSAGIPLCVTLEGALTPIDTLHEALLSLVRAAPRSLLSVPRWALAGRATLRREIGLRESLDVAQLPLNTQLLEWLQNERECGRRIVLATSGDSGVAARIASRLDLFDEVIASDGINDSSARGTTKVLVERFGEQGFDYVSREAANKPVWRSARKAIFVGTPSQVAQASRILDVDKAFVLPAHRPAIWIKAIRIHQWMKNVLVFLPALLAHRILAPEVFLQALGAFVAFGLCASSVYLINDLVDLTADRHHPRKPHRPIAAGLVPPRGALAAAALLFVASASLAICVSPRFAAVLAVYYVLTWGYSLRLKRAALLDVVTLAALYTMRIVAGSAATAVPLSFWLLALSVFIFLSLALVKRYAELSDAYLVGKAASHGRGYAATDLPLLMSLGVAAGYAAVLVMALYINSPDAQILYRHNKPLWLICPLLLYWVSRAWLLTTRGRMHDDPVVFALRDPASLIVLCLLGLVVSLSI